jgi:hypothetical protein
MDDKQQQPKPFPAGFVEQVNSFFQEQVADGVHRLVCYDRDGKVSLAISLPVAARDQAAADYRQAWQIWRAGGSLVRIRAELREGLPQNEDRQTLTEIPDFGLEA